MRWQGRYWFFVPLSFNKSILSSKERLWNFYKRSGTNVSRLQSINVLKINVILIMIKSIPLFLSYMYQMKTALITCLEMKLNVSKHRKSSRSFLNMIDLHIKDFKVSISKQILGNSKQYWTLNVEVRSFWRLL